MADENKIVKRKNYLPNADENAYTFDSEDEKAALSAKVLNFHKKYLFIERVKDNEDAEERIGEYIGSCIASGLRPTVEGLALCLGVTRSMLWDWETGRITHGNGRNYAAAPISSDTIRKAKEFIATYDAQLVSMGKLNPVVYIFRSKNFYGMKDQTETIVTPNVSREEERAVLLEQAEALPEE